METFESLDGVLAPDAINQLQSIVAEFNEKSANSMDSNESAGDNQEDLMLRCQQVIAKLGRLHIANIAPLTR